MYRNSPPEGDTANGVTRTRSDVPRAAQYPDRQHDNAAHECEGAIDRDPENAERDQEKPHERVQHERQEGERPAEHEQDAPQQELRHTWEYEKAAGIVR